MGDHNAIYTYKRFFPAEPLAAFVKFFYYFHGAGNQSERILPQSLAEILIRDATNFIDSHEFKAFAGTHPRGFLQESNQLNGINARSWLSLGGKTVTMDSVSVLTEKTSPGERFYGNVGQDFMQQFKEFTIDFRYMYVKGI